MKNVGKLGYLYFLTSAHQKAVKVGFATDPAQRIPSLQSGNPAPLKVSMVIPIESEAEIALHAFMRPHRIVREWYPDDTLMLALAGELIEVWGDKVQEAANDFTPETWVAIGDEWANPAEVYLTAKEVGAAMKRLVAEFFDGEQDEGDEPEDTPIVNHWLPKPKPKVRRLRERLADLRTQS